MSKSAIYTVNAIKQPIYALSNTIVNLGLPVNKFGSNLAIVEGNILVRGCGYYDVNVNLILEASRSGETEIQIYQDGIAIPGANAKVTLTDNTIYSIVIPTIIKSANSTITVGIFGATGDITSVATKVIKI